MKGFRTDTMVTSITASEEPTSLTALGKKKNLEILFSNGYLVRQLNGLISCFHLLSNQEFGRADFAQFLTSEGQ